MFVNLAVRNLEEAKDFFTALGFSANPEFTDDKAACMIVNDEASVMLADPAVLQDIHQAGHLRHQPALMAVAWCTSSSAED